MSGTWYDATGAQRVGPISLDDLRAALRRLPNWTDMAVWPEGLSDWQRAGDVPELASRPPPLLQDAASAPAPAKPPPGKERQSSSKVFAGIGVLVVVLLVSFGSFLIGRQGGPQFFSLSHAQDLPDASLKRLQGAVTVLQKELPKKLDEETTMIGTELEGTTVVYTVRIEAVKSALEVDVIEAEFRPGVLQGICASPNAAGLLKQGASYKYVYVDKVGEHMGTFVVKKGDC